MRAPESLANCSADLRALAVASAISAGLIALSLVYSKSGAVPMPPLLGAEHHAARDTVRRCGSSASALATSVVRRITVVE